MRHQGHVETIQSIGYRGSRSPVYTWCQRWLQEQAGKPRNAGFVPLSFELGEAFQFDWSCEYALIGGIRRRLEVDHIKLAASRAFLLVAYHAQPMRCYSMPLPPSAACTSAAYTTT